MANNKIYKNIDALAPVKKVLDEVGQALSDSTRTIKTSDIPEILGAVAGGTVGVGTGLALVSTAGLSGVSAAGLASGLATLGSVIGGGMLAGIFVAGAPMAILGTAGYGLIASRNKKKLKQYKETLFQEAVRKHDAIIRELNDKVNMADDRQSYLESLNFMLRQIVKDLEMDLAA